MEGIGRIPLVVCSQPLEEDSVWVRKMNVGLRVAERTDTLTNLCASTPYPKGNQLS